MENFRFESPVYLLLLLALPVFQVVLSRIHRNAREKLLRFMAEPNLVSLLKEKGKGGGDRKRYFFWAGLVLMILALARPQANPTVEEMEGASLDIYALIDVSRSMDAEDIAPSRLKKAKRSVQSLMSLLSGDRLGVIAFAGTAVIVSPLTTDYEVIKTFLQNVDSSLIQNQGTDLGNALQMAEEAMQRGAEKTGNSGPRTNVFVVMSDGEDHQPQDLSVVDRINQNGGVVFAIAFGTEAGSTIPIRNQRGELSGRKRDGQGNDVKTTVQTSTLREIAERGGGQFYFSTLEEEEIRDILNRVQGMDRTSAAIMRARVYKEYFAPVLALGIFLTIFSFFSLRTLFQLPFRKTTALAILAFSIPPPHAEAAPESFLWDKEKRAFEAGKTLSAEGKPDEAVERLKSLLAEDPDNPELNYNIGTFLLEGKKPEEARTQLQRLVEKDNRLREEALFNIAGSYAQEGKKAEARAAYAELLRSLKGKNEPQDKELEAMTRKNLARLMEKSQDQEKSEQNQPKPEGGGGDEKKDPQPGDKGEPKDPKDKKDENKEGDGQQDKSQDKNSEGEQKDPKKENEQKGEEPNDKDEKPGENKPPPPKGMRPARPQFQEKENMGEEDAKRILEALKQRETNLQKDFLKKKDEGKNSDNENGKDW